MPKKSTVCPQTLASKQSLIQHQEPATLTRNSHATTALLLRLIRQFDTADLIPDRPSTIREMVCNERNRVLDWVEFRVEPT